jgi:hypothetical protein
MNKNFISVRLLTVMCKASEGHLKGINAFQMPFRCPSDACDKVIRRASVTQIETIKFGYISRIKSSY